MLAPSAARRTNLMIYLIIALIEGVSLEDCSQDAVQDLRREEGNRGDVLGLITTIGVNHRAMTITKLGKLQRTGRSLSSLQFVSTHAHRPCLYLLATNWPVVTGPCVGGNGQEWPGGSGPRA